MTAQSDFDPAHPELDQSHTSSTRHLLETGRDRLRRGREELQTEMQSARKRAEHFASESNRQVREAAYRTKRKSGEMVDRHPLALGVAGFAAGILIGMALPRSKTEDTYLGSSRDELLRKGRDNTARLSQDVRNRAQNFARQTREQVENATHMRSNGKDQGDTSV